MLELIKEKIVSKGMSLLQSPTVAKVMESEKMGVIVEKAMSIPIKLSSTLMSGRERLIALLDLVTQQDLDDLRQNLARIENVLRDFKKESSDLLRKVDEKESGKTVISE